MCRKRIDKYLENRHQGETKKFSEVLERLLDPDAARGHVVPSAFDLNEEAMTILTAGNDTTSNAMILGAYFICSHPQVHARLVEELQKGFPNVHGSITYDEAKELPYLVCATPSPVMHYQWSIREKRLMSARLPS